MPRKQEVEAAEEASSKSARTRERILDAAAHVLSRKGYAGTRLSDVADQAEIQAPAIYYYFPSRDDLIEEVMWTGIARMREHMSRVLAAMPSGTDPLARIDAAVEALVAFGAAGEDAARDARGPGTFHVNLYDSLAALDPETIDARARVS